MNTSADVTIQWELVLQKFKACPKHVQGGEPFDADCPDCEITDPPIVAEVNPHIEAAP